MLEATVLLIGHFHWYILVLHQREWDDMIECSVSAIYLSLSTGKEQEHNKVTKANIQLKYTIEGVSKILVPRDQIYFPRRSRGK